MGKPAAKQGDRITATDTHIVMVQDGPITVPKPFPHPFTGIINANTSADVNIMGRAAATVASSADNVPPHVPTPPGLAFQRPPANKASVKTGSQTVKINGKPAARHGDSAMTCNDPADLPVGAVVATATVNIG